MQKVSCSTCDGTGKVSLSPKLAEVIKAFKRKTTKLVASDFNFEGVTVNAVNNRLESLRKMGMLERARRGRAWEYFKPAPKKEENGTA